MFFGWNSIYAPIQTNCSQIKEIYRDQHALQTGLGSCHYDVITEHYIDLWLKGEGELESITRCKKQ